MKTKLHNEIFSQRVAELLSEGYKIFVDAMGGHQGELGKVCFEKDGRYYALYAKHASSWINEDGTDEELPWETIDIVFGEAEESYDPERGSPMWIDHLREIQRTSLYILGDYRRSFTLTADRDLAIQAAKKRSARAEFRYAWHRPVTKEYNEGAVIDAVYHILKRREGCSLLRKHQIKACTVEGRGIYNRIVAHIERRRKSVRTGEMVSVIDHIELFRAKSA